MAERVPGGGDDAEAQEAFEYDVFLSFASANQEAADAICRTLREGGLRVFWAPDTLDDAMGRSFVNAIGARLLGSRHFVLFWTAEAKESQWVQEEHETFYSQCYIRARGARRLVILPDGREPLSTLPVLLRNLQIARSAQEVLARLKGSPPVRQVVVPSHVESPRSVHSGQKLVVTRPAALTAGTAIDGPLGMRMRFVPSGTYTVGEDREQLRAGHKVRFTRGLWLAETPITQAQWRRLIPNQVPSFFGGDDIPVAKVSWEEAIEFANRLSDREGLAQCYQLVAMTGSLEQGDFNFDSATFIGTGCTGYRLPTESEWEVAARASGPRPGSATKLDDVAWYDRNSKCQPQPVGQKASNSWGFFDLLGNVSEWVWDAYAEYPNKKLLVDPIGPSSRYGERVIRGGSWDSEAWKLDVARRDWSWSRRSISIGFRLARSHSPLQGSGSGLQSLWPWRRGKPP